jgi:hypothetical protein
MNVLNNIERKPVTIGDNRIGWNVNKIEGRRTGKIGMRKPTKSITMDTRILAATDITSVSTTGTTGLTDGRSTIHIMLVTTVTENIIIIE